MIAFGIDGLSWQRSCVLSLVEVFPKGTFSTANSGAVRLLAYALFLEAQGQKGVVSPWQAAQGEQQAWARGRAARQG